MLFGKAKRRVNRLLVVEDEPLVAFDNEHVLREAGYEVVDTVESVDRALKVIADVELDLVVLDVSLSDGGTGVDVAAGARARGVPVLFVTGHCPVDARALAVGCLAKPYGPKDLLGAIDAVDALLEGRPPRRPPAGLSLYGMPGDRAG